MKKKNLIFILVIVNIFLISNELNGKNSQNLIASEIIRINDDDESFYFIWPYNLRISESDNIYFQDKDQLLLFDKSGKFKKNIIKVGQGPGEVLRLSNFMILSNEIFLHNSYPNKMISIDYEGRLIKENRLDYTGFYDFFYLSNNYFYFLETESKNTNNSAKVTDIKRILFSIDRKRMKKHIKLVFPLKAFVYKSPKAFFMVKLNQLKSAKVENELFFISNTNEYEINLFDISKGVLINKFSKNYKRVKLNKINENYINMGQFSIDNIKYESPKPDFVDDIQSIFFHSGELWIFTSTVNEKNGVQVDVLSKSGSYLRSFYLKFPSKETHYQLKQSQVFIKESFIYILERDKSDEWSMVKYEMRAIR